MAASQEMLKIREALRDLDLKVVVSYRDKFQNYLRMKVLIAGKSVTSGIHSMNTPEPAIKRHFLTLVARLKRRGLDVKGDASSYAGVGCACCGRSGLTLIIRVPFQEGT